jgi:hypothetical protein
MRFRWYFKWRISLFREIKRKSTFIIRTAFLQKVITPLHGSLAKCCIQVPLFRELVRKYCICLLLTKIQNLSRVHILSHFMTFFLAVAQIFTLCLSFEKEKWQYQPFTTNVYRYRDITPSDSTPFRGCARKL